MSVVSSSKQKLISVGCSAKLITAASALSGTDEGAAEFVDNNGVERLSRFVLESTLASTRASRLLIFRCCT